MGAYADPNVQIIDQSRAKIGEGIQVSAAAFAKSFSSAMATKNKKIKDLNDMVGDWGNAYEKEIKKEKQAAMGEVNKMDDDENRDKVNDELTQAFADGKARIVEAVKAGLPPSEIQKIFDKEVAGAESFAKSIYGFGQISEEVVGAINTARSATGDQKGKADGSIYVGNPTYADIFNIYGDGQTGNSKYNWSNVRVMKRPDSKGNWDYVTWIDKNNNDAYDDGEAVDFRAAAETWEKGKGDDLYTTINNDDKAVNRIQGRLRNTTVGINAGQFRTTGTVVDVTNQLQTTETIDQPDLDKIQDALYFEGGAVASELGMEDEEGYAGSLSQQIDDQILAYGDNNLEKGVGKYYQKYFGMDAATDFLTKLNSFPPDSEQRKAFLAQGFLAVKDQYISRNVLSEIKGVNTKTRTRILSGGTTRVSTTSDPARVDAITTHMQGELDFINDAIGNHNPPTTAQETTELAGKLDTRYTGQPYNNIRRVDRIVAGQWSYDTSTKQWSMVPGTDATMMTIIGDMKGPTSTPATSFVKNEDIRGEDGIIEGFTLGKFRKEDDKALVQYNFGPGLKNNASTNNMPIYDSSGYKPKTNVSTSNPKYPQGQRVVGNNLVSNKPVSTVVKGNAPPNPQGSNVGSNVVQPGSGSYGSNAQINPQTNIVQFNFNGLNVDADKAVAGYPVMTMKNDGDDYIRSMGNFETLAGNANGGGVKGYGFSGANPELARLYNNAPGGNKEEKFIYSVNTYIIGKDGGNAKYGGKKTILTDLGISRAEFDALPEGVRKELVDWKFNSGRGTTDLILIAAGGDWDGNRAYRSNSPTPKQLVVDDPSNPGNPKPIDLKNLDVAKLREARKELYEKRIEGLKADIASGKVDPNGKPANANKPSDPTYKQILQFAEDGYNNSQQYR